MTDRRVRLIDYRTGEPGNPFAYPAAPFEDAEKAPSPRYDLLVRWMKRISGRAATIDYWARGNYARRLLTNRRDGVMPVIVPVGNLDEIRWAYRRLALLGVPMEFLWQGPLSPPLKVNHLHPSNPDDIIDAGWGYLYSGGTVAKSRGQRWSLITGYARLMPESVASWLVDEAGDALIAGHVFITPAALVGVDSVEESVQGVYETVVGGLPVRASPPAEVLLNLELPGLDDLRPSAFNDLLVDHAFELERLRLAFRKLVDAGGTGALDSIVAEINFEAAELALADRYHGFRSRVTRLGGVLTTCAAGVGTAVAAASGSLFAGVAAASVSAATTGLIECVRGHAERSFELRRHPLYLLWRLGADKSGLLRPSRPKRYEQQSREDAPIRMGEDGYFHWLAPPTGGRMFTGVRKEPLEP